MWAEATAAGPEDLTEVRAGGCTIQLQGLIDYTKRPLTLNHQKI